MRSSRRLLMLEPSSSGPSRVFALLAKFKDPAEVRLLVRNQLLARAEVAFGFVQAYYSTLDLRLIAADNSNNLLQCYSLITDPAAAVVDKLEKNTETELLAQIQQET